MTTMTIGELSRESGVKATTIRFYEEIGLVDPPPRTQGNRRLYGAAALQRLRFIRHARDLGFEIPDIRALLTLASTPNAPCEAADALASRHLRDVERRIAQLSALRDELARMIAGCRHGAMAECRVVEALAQDCPNHDHADRSHASFSSAARV